ncbi:hypothetical protein [Arsukibacterium sp.]|uniref:hypothetical protein n=1 Tax=Arsukibacterium sp. TaxID=1977258 RepID=UPI002FD91ED8
MQTVVTKDYSLLNQRCQLVPVWLKFIGICLFGLWFLFFLFVTAQWFNNTAPDAVSFPSGKSPWVLSVIWLYFLVYASSFYGLISGRYWGLIACMVLSYLSLLNAGFTLVTEGRIDLMLVIVVALLLYQLHSIKAKWARLSQ